MPTARGIQVFRPPMARFLNDYLEVNQDQLPSDSETLRDRFTRATALLNEARGVRALKIRGTQVNAAHTDAVLVGLMSAFEQRSDISAEDVSTALEALLENDRYQDAISESTSHSEQVSARIRLAAKAFRGESIADEQG